ncbi:MAG: DUF4160 domain-containing protein [Calditrichaeota bacterium]|nr:DUF4160 domain-containing protein [Calditrichota bacterium]
MSELSRFFGIVITMRFNDHSPPHIHIKYGNQNASINIITLDILGGKLSNRALNLVREWILAHRYELLSNWQRARKQLPLNPIKPLE